MRLVVAIVLSLAGTARADDVPRVRAHLTRVLAELRAVDTSPLAPEQRANRSAALATLEAYARSGMFPRRTGDPYGALRPRFIDDRGVHCAVGALIAASGREDLARAINARYEYAYVRDMRAPALVAWATEHGFTVDELARIQPSYSGLPTPDSARRQLADAKDAVTLACAALHPPSTRVALHVFGLDSGAVRVSVASSDPFARCIASRLSEVERGGHAYAGRPEAYDFAMDMTLSTPQQLLDTRLANMHDIDDCAPRPGALVHSVTFGVKSDSDGLAVLATTTPANSEVEVCVEDLVARRLSDFTAGAWELRGQRTFPVRSRLDVSGLRDQIAMYLANDATDCYRPTPPARVKVRVTAHVDDPDFDIVVEGSDAGFATCVSAKLRPTLHDVIAVSRKRGERFERYFRIDRDIDIRVDVPIESREAREKRLEDARKRIDRERYRY